MMDNETFLNFEDEVLNTLATKLSGFQTTYDINKIIEKTSKIIDPEISKEDIDRLIKDANVFYPIEKYIDNDEVEDVMVNNTSNVFIYHAEKGAIIKFAGLIFNPSAYNHNLPAIL